MGVRIDVGVREILAWCSSILVVEELWTVLELYNGIRDGHIQVPSTAGRQFQFPEELKEQPLYAGVGSKQSGPFNSCSLSAKLGEIAAFGTYIKFSLEQSKDAEPSKQPPVRSVNQVLMQAQVSEVDMRNTRAREQI